MVPVTARKTVLLGAEPSASLWSAVNKLVDKNTGKYDLPKHKFFEGVERLHAQEGASGEGQLVAVVDSGISESHPLLKGAVLAAVDFSDDGTSNDLHGHGTLVALIIRYVAPKAKLLNVKVINRSCNGSEEALVAGLDWAGKHNATIVNVSAGILWPDPVAHFPMFLRKLCANLSRRNPLLYTLRRHWVRRCPVCESASKLQDSGVLVCVAVGNKKGKVLCPGRNNRNKRVMVVSAATLSTNRVPAYAGSWPDLTAPELPLTPGTSFSSAFLSGSLALLMELCESLSRTSAPAFGGLYARANMFFDAGAFTEAIALYNLILHQESHLIEHSEENTSTQDCKYCVAFIFPIRMRLGLAYLHTEHGELAMEQFAENVKVSPSFAPAYVNLAAAYFAIGDHGEATARYAYAILLDPNEVNAYIGIANVADVLGNRAQAILAMKNAIRICPDYPDLKARLNQYLKKD